MVCSGIYHVNFYMQINFDLKKVKVTQLCPTFCNPVDSTVWNSPGQNAGVVAGPFSRGSSQPRDRTQVYLRAGRFFTSLANREVLI